MSLATHWGGLVAYCWGLAARESLTLELECPHIVRALQLYSRVSSGRITPLAHPERGMTRHNILGIARNFYELMRLCVAAQDVVDCGWILFSYVSSAGMPSVLDCRRDFLGLVGYEGTKQEALMCQIEKFIVRVARRSIVDMVRLGNMEKLATMWYKNKDEGLPRPHCDQVLQGNFYCAFWFCILHVKTPVLMLLCSGLTHADKE